MLRGWLAALAMLLLSGCASLQYYLQAAHGHFSLMEASRPIDELLQEGQLAPALAQRLRRVRQMRHFAVEALDLPDNNSYLSFAQLHTKAVVWSVVASGEFSLQPRTWCFLMVGCTSYRGYYHQADARALADQLQSQGEDVVVVEVPAYSTLGWFDDPLPSTVADWPESAIAALIFHELAHQVVYVKDDSGFNEAFATAVARAGTRAWLRHRGDANAQRYLQTSEKIQQRFLRQAFATRDRLASLYQQDLPAREMRRRKTRVIEELRQWHAQHIQPGDPYHDWFRKPVNNARFVLLATYLDLVPGFARLLEQVDGNYAEFYARVRSLAEDSPQQRRQYLAQLATGTVTRPSSGTGIDSGF